MTFIDTVRSQARGIQYGRLLASGLLLIPYAVGWLLGKAAAAITALLYAIGWLGGKTSLAIRYAASAVQIGWADARAPKSGGNRWAS